MDILYIIIGILSFILLLYNIVEISYFVRLFIVANVYRIWYLRKKVAIIDELSTYGICLISDIDFLFHMNHSRYLREFEFSRMKYMVATGIARAANSLNATIVISAITVRYRRSVQLFDVFKIRHKLLYWKDRDFYVESRLETTKDKFVRTICVTKLTITNGVTFEDLLNYLSIKIGFVDIPEPQEDLKKWLEFNRISSIKLKKEQQIKDAKNSI